MIPNNEQTLVFDGESSVPVFGWVVHSLQDHLWNQSGCVCAVLPQCQMNVNYCWQKIFFFSLWIPILTTIRFISWHNIVEKHIPVLRCYRCWRDTRSSSQWLSKQKWRKKELIVSYLMQEQPLRLRICRCVHTSASWCLGRRMKSIGDFTLWFHPAFYKFLLPIGKRCSVVRHMHDNHNPFEVTCSCSVHLKWSLNTWGKITFSQCVKVVVWRQNNTETQGLKTPNQIGSRTLF